MSLKVLIVPILIIASLVIGIGYVKPDIMLLLEKKQQLDQLNVQADSVDGLVSRVQSLGKEVASTNSDSSSQMTDAEFLRQVYFPVSSDIERGVDQLNFLAASGGILVSDIEAQDVVAKVVDEEMSATDEVANVNSGGLPIASAVDESSLGVLPVSVQRTYTPDTYTLTIKTSGSYAATKQFYEQVSRMKRSFVMQKVKLATHAEEVAGALDGANTAPPSNGVLDSEYELEFPLLPPVSIVSALGDATFDQSRLHFETIAAVRQSQEGNTPVLPGASPLGKSNPFE